MAYQTQTLSATYLKGCVVAGATSSTDITCAAGDGTAMAYGDTLLMVWELDASNNAWTDRTGNSEIQSDGELQCTDATDGDDLLVIWDASTSNSNLLSNPRIQVFAEEAPSPYNTITITGITTSDRIAFAGAINTTSGLLTDITEACSITGDDTVDVSGGATSPAITEAFIVVWDHMTSVQANSAYALKSFLATGVSAGADMTVTGIGADDELIGVIELHGTDYSIVGDHLSTSIITAASTIVVTGATDSNSDVVWVVWNRRDL